MIKGFIIDVISDDFEHSIKINLDGMDEKQLDSVFKKESLSLGSGE